MRMELPLCNLHTCRYYSDGNCLNKTMYIKCEYTLSKYYLIVAQDLIDEYNNKHEYYDWEGYWNNGAVEALEELLRRMND